MPYKAIKTDDGVKVVECSGEPKIGNYADALDTIVGTYDNFAYHIDYSTWFAAATKYPTLPTDNWDFDRVYRDDEVRIEWVYRWNYGNYNNKCTCCNTMFIGAKLQRVCETCCSLQFAISNIQEDEWDEAIDEADAAANAKYNFTQTPLMWCEYFISYLRNNYSIKRK